MTTAPLSPDAPQREPSREEIFTSLFADTIKQQATTALMFLGRIPNPETGERFQEPDSARVYIYQLEMLEARTRGNLTQFEQDFLAKGLTAVRQAFQEVTGQDITPGLAAEAPSLPVVETTPAPLPPEAPAPGPTAPPESRKRYSKTY